ncbi:hypothetical protein TrCOL_g7932 [Triparma columacea]|uniref:PARP-type domain-containing protein n=1 Tax=Triparma columacea TaxID=722753 RepID=A0A9W7L293_9STRA|nr:hypothetical protein TrCOL_g7932 [Triparma columacea]
MKPHIPHHLITPEKVSKKRKADTKGTEEEGGKKLKPNALSMLQWKRNASPKRDTSPKRKKVSNPPLHALHRRPSVNSYFFDRASRFGTRPTCQTCRSFIAAGASRLVVAEPIFRSGGKKNYRSHHVECVTERYADDIKRKHGNIRDAPCEEGEGGEGRDIVSKKFEGVW